TSGHRLFISAFMLASKIICDDTYSNKSWCRTSISLYTSLLLFSRSRLSNSELTAPSFTALVSRNDIPSLPTSSPSDTPRPSLGLLTSIVGIPTSRVPHRSHTDPRPLVPWGLSSGLYLTSVVGIAITSPIPSIPRALSNGLYPTGIVGIPQQHPSFPAH
ncbi:hypothetical protein EDB85DRAFT_1872108, partial [Lactarius pseudohatsudake]